MAEPRRLSASNSAQHLPGATTSGQRVPPSASSVSLAFPQSTSMHSLLASQVRSSGTWTTSSGELGLLSDTDEVEDRAIFVHEYNRLAKKHGVRLLIVDDFHEEQQCHNMAKSPEKRGWLYRLLRANNEQTTSSPGQLQLRHKRSVSDLAHMIRSRLEPPRVVYIQDMVRLSGKSMLYLPQDYAPCSLVLPTCLRATAQHLAQNANTRGLFRIPGSVKVVTALFDYYCCPEPGGESISSTVRCANLPMHIALSVHDVASTFKKLLSVLPGGILGSLSLFDALVAVHSQLNGEPEFPRTKQTKVRARLIALAIGTVKSQFRRELICAVLGLLSLIGRVAEVTPREDADGRPLPTANLMGYGALGIVFGPLLVGDLLDQYTMKLATPTGGLLLLPFSPPKLRRERRRTRPDGNRSGPPTVNKIMVANDIAEMLIANWRDVVRQMRSLGAHHHRKGSSLVNARGTSVSEPFAIKMPRDLDAVQKGPNQSKGEHEGPEPDTPTMGLKRRRNRPVNMAPHPKLLSKVSMQTLTPTIEEGSTEETSARLEAVSEQDRGKDVDGEAVPRPEVAKSVLGEVKAKGPKDTIPAPPPILPQRVPPRLSSRSNRSQDCSEVQTIKSCGTEGDSSATKGQMAKASRKRRQSKTSNNTGSHDGLRGSIGNTPDHLYPPTDGRSRSSQGVSEDMTQVAARRQPGSPTPGNEGRHGSKQAEASDPPFNAGPATGEKSLATQAPASKPHRKRPVRFLVQSPSHSDSSERLSKKGSVKAMAAMFEGQGLNLARMSCPGHGEGANEGAELLQQTASPCPCQLLGRGDGCASDGLVASPQDDQAMSSRAGFMKDAAAVDEPPCRHIAARRSLPMLPPCLSCSSPVHAQELRWACMGHDKEQVPVAQCRKLTRSLSMPPLGYQAAGEGRVLDAAAHPADTLWGSSALFCQMHKLQRRLSIEAEEAAQLRRQLESREDAEVGALSRELSTARRDKSMWKERAESAERRVKAFERFAARMRDLKESIMASQHGVDETAGRPQPRNEVAKDMGSNARSAHKSSAEFGGTTMGSDGAGSRREFLSRQSAEAEQIWAAMEELLRMEDVEELLRMKEGGAAEGKE
ncbi:hypothetical protein L249_7772 [Ophiocordyceps polyrhachis-furcata BCC 54312]|uniref:Rho-GAP domain-containing protein n=1 Tax=Ophiocordyceps polyrhachis-furcata BCC 54312 TaxID=1330021 RepID=A0A367LAY5_9HYPO|nr:hypothetical protein L249_7772 [Ophiocordyceps polyrhachis-furcata BCC 54312]